MKESQLPSADAHPPKSKGVALRWAIACTVYLCFVAAICLTLMPSSSWYWKATAANTRPKASSIATQTERSQLLPSPPPSATYAHENAILLNRSLR
ncbi:MAG: hypothetical protein AAFX40_13000 [Cyanobacteria bacterium J06639_1]